jgi:phage protein D
MADVAYAAAASIVVDGWKLEPDVDSYVEQVVVDEHVQLPAMFAITLLDPAHDILDKSGMRVGAEVEVSLVGQGQSGDDALIKGDVVSVEGDYDEVGSRVVVRGYAASHRLHRGQRTATFQDSTDSDIVRKVANTAGIDLGEITETAEVHPHVSQANVTDWDFLSERARRSGFDLEVVAGKLRFGPPRTIADAPPEADLDGDPDSLPRRHLVLGDRLLSFHGRISAAEQVAEVEVHGYDLDRKEAVVATASAGTVAAEIGLADPTTLAGFFGDQTFISTKRSLKSQREVEAEAKAIAERIGSAFAEADGVALGNTELRAGMAIRVASVSEDFDGAYVITSARHVIDSLGYRTHFSISGRHDRSLLGLLGSGRSGRAGGTPASQAIPGIVRAIVSENDDPDKLGRVKVSFPWLDEKYSSTWAPVVQLGAGPASGTFFLPAVHDEVLVGFEHGLVDRPIVFGGLFNTLDKPPEYGHFLDDGRVVGRSIVSRKGHEINFFDADDNSALTIHVVGGSGTPVVSIGLNADDSKLVIQSEGNVDVTAEKEINLKASKITVQADGDLVLKGGMVKIN